jgi:hypothetical protein
MPTTKRFKRCHQREPSRLKKQGLTRDFESAAGGKEASICRLQSGVWSTSTGSGLVGRWQRGPVTTRPATPGPSGSLKPHVNSGRQGAAGSRRRRTGMRRRSVGHGEAARPPLLPPAGKYRADGRWTLPELSRAVVARTDPWRTSPCAPGQTDLCGMQTGTRHVAADRTPLRRRRRARTGVCRAQRQRPRGELWSLADCPTALLPFDMPIGALRCDRSAPGGFRGLGSLTGRDGRHKALLLGAGSVVQGERRQRVHARTRRGWP